MVKRNHSKARVNSTKVKILHLTTDSRIVGTEKNIIDLVTHLDKDRYENIVVALMPGRELMNKLRALGIKAECLAMRSKFDLLEGFRLYRVIKDGRADILHTYLFHANILGRVVGKLARAPVIISSIRVMERRRHHLWIDWLTNWMVDVETCVCEAVREFTIQKARIRPEKLVTILNGIDVEQYDLNIDTGDKKKELGVDSNYPILGVAGRLHEQKGHVYLLKAMPWIIREHPKAVLLVAGDGPLRRKLENLCSKLLIDTKIKFLGIRYDIKEIMSMVDVFILPSLWEGMPNVLLEAMALGRAIVATRVGGVEELIDDGASGILVAPGDEEQLAEAIIGILARPNGGGVLGREARKEVSRKFSPENMVSGTEKLYERFSS